MIADKIENVKLYKALGTRLSLGLEYISATDLQTLAPGRYEISEGVFALISAYDTKDEIDCKPEAHEKYIDIQYIISGSELIGYVPLSKQVPSIPYNVEKDLVFYKEAVSYVQMDAGMFAIFFPTDIHQPCVKIKTSAPVKKLVVKVLV